MSLHGRSLAGGGGGASAGSGRRLVLAHGFTQNAGCWGPFGAALAATDSGVGEVVAVDLPGHGATPARYDTADLDTAGRLLVEAGGPAVYVGYSMGGRVALHGALGARPGGEGRASGGVEGLVLIGSTGGLDHEDDRAQRRQADEALAQRLLADGLAPFLDRWLTNPLFAGLRPEAACLPARLTNRPEGLAASLRHCGTGTQRSLWSDLASLEVPTLLLVGADDAKFTALGQRLVATLPQAELVVLAGTHAVHLEQPEAAAQAVQHFVASLPPPPSRPKGT